MVMVDHIQNQGPKRQSHDGPYKLLVKNL